MDELLHRIHHQQHAAVIGEPPDLPEDELTVIRATCTGRPLDVVLEVIELVSEIAGHGMGDARDRRIRRALRRRILGERQEPERAQLFVAALDALAQAAPNPPVVVIEHADRADPETSRLLQQVVGRPGLSPVSIVLVFDRAPVGDPESLAESATTESPEIPAQARRVLRAAALIGNRFDVEAVAKLLETGETHVLEMLQQAHDLGVPVMDYGDGHFTMPAAVARALKSSLLPSLRAAWGQRLRAVGGGMPESDVPLTGSAPEELDDRAQPVTEADDPPVPEHPPPAADLVSEPRPLPDDAAEALDHASRAASVGAYEEAIRHARHALDILDDDEERPLRVEILLELASMLWESRGKEARRFDEALEVSEQAYDLLEDEDPPDLRAAACEVVAGISYDIGSPEALERALQRLSEGIRALRQADDPLAAARLLNDQAAVYVRLGDVVQAAHILSKSREIFTKLADSDPSARIEVAETEHLMARLPLHVEIREDHEEDALLRADHHAATAEALYQELEDDWSLGRIWETRGRLATLRGDTADAARWLSQAGRAQKKTGDVLGLARSVNALAGAMESAGRYPEALALLGQSIQLNLKRGTPLGVAYNRRSLEFLLEKVPPERLEALSGPLQKVARELARAEAALGRVELPGD